MIHGILVEGTDYAGKTTVCALVARLLGAAGARARVGHGYLNEGPIFEFFSAEAKRSRDLLQIDWFCSLNMLMDLADCRRQPPERFVVQDQHWLSQVGRNRFFHEDAPGLPTQRIWDEHLPFAHQFYLTSDMPTKRARCRLRPVKSARDAYLRAHPGAHQAYDESMLALLPRDEAWTVIDTSALSPYEVAARIMAAVRPQAGPRARRAAQTRGEAA